MRSHPYRLVCTAPADLDWIVALERREHAAPFVGQWTVEQHLRTLADIYARHLTVATPAGERVGFVLLLGLTDPNRTIELKRIVIDPPGHGHGAHALHATQRLTFDELGAHRLWLDVKEHNARARTLYRSVGFNEEGVARDAVLLEGSFESLVIMSMLEEEYRTARGMNRI